LFGESPGTFTVVAVASVAEANPLLACTGILGVVVEYPTDKGLAGRSFFYCD
jgi:hypothetical protein